MWFAVSLLFESQHAPNARTAPLWEESIRIVDASSQNDAVLAGEQFGKHRANAYLADGATVTWIFRGVQNAFPLEQDKAEPGVEVFSRFLRDSEARSLLTPFKEDE